ncbi:MAG TPA: energy transducer TonB, partial [Porphyromonadaceae bacterium]|nr:energy transducer TonB [Porphyromonadaceae bacterium]
MEIKKTTRANIEKDKITYFLCGLALILAVLLVAFEWSTKKVVKYSDEGVRDADFEEELIPQTQQPEVLPPPPPMPEIIQELKVVEDDKKVKDVEIKSLEDSQNQAQEFVSTAEEEDEEEIFTIVEEMPKFPGGDAALLRYIGENVNYPTVAAENGIQGRVVCSFIIDKEGKVKDVQVVKKVDPSLDKEAMRVLISMPRWTPGKQRGKAVSVKYMV